MEKVLIVGCKRAMDDICIACSRCCVAFNRREGEFSRYEDAEILGLLNCGDCPGAAIVPRLAQVKLGIDKLHSHGRHIRIYEL